MEGGPKREREREGEREQRREKREGREEREERRESECATSPGASTWHAPMVASLAVVLLPAGASMHMPIASRV